MLASQNQQSSLGTAGMVVSASMSRWRMSGVSLTTMSGDDYLVERLLTHGSTRC
jgi:hypothetical protein